MGEKCASKNQFKSKLDFQNQQYKAQHKHTHMADYNNISESPFPSSCPPPHFLLSRNVTHTQSLNMSLEKSFVRRKYFVAAWHPSPLALPVAPLHTANCQKDLKDLRAKAVSLRLRLFILYARHTFKQRTKTAVLSV